MGDEEEEKKTVGAFIYVLPGSKPLLYFIHARRERSIEASFDRSNDRVMRDRSFLFFSFFDFSVIFLKPRNHLSDFRLDALRVRRKLEA